MVGPRSTHTKQKALQKHLLNPGRCQPTVLVEATMMTTVMRRSPEAKKVVDQPQVLMEVPWMSKEASMMTTACMIVVTRMSPEAKKMVDQPHVLVEVPWRPKDGHKRSV